MSRKKKHTTCPACDPSNPRGGEYCEQHAEDLHQLEHHYESFFRLQRTSRGGDHETYFLFVQGGCSPCGRVLTAETDSDNLVLTVLLSVELDLNATIMEFDALAHSLTFGDLLRERLEEDIVRSWYGNVRACIDVFRVNLDEAVHWDIAPRSVDGEEDPEEDPLSGTKHTIH